MEHAQKYHIQHHIHKGGEDQVVQRVPAVSHRMEDAHEDVIHHGEDGAPEVIAKIIDGLGQHIFRRVHPLQNGGGKDHARNGEERAGDEAEGHIRMDGPGHAGVIPRAEIPGDHHARAHGDPVEKADHHEDQAAGGAYRRHGVVANEFTDRPGIEGVVELLKDVAQQDRQGK